MPATWLYAMVFIVAVLYILWDAISESIDDIVAHSLEPRSIATGPHSETLAAVDPTCEQVREALESCHGSEANAARLLGLRTRYELVSVAQEVQIGADSAPRRLTERLSPIRYSSGALAQRDAPGARGLSAWGVASVGGVATWREWRARGGLRTYECVNESLRAIAHVLLLAFSLSPDEKVIKGPVDTSC